MSDTFLVLDASAEVPSLACGTIGPIGWSCECISAWDNTLVHSAKVVLPDNSFICYSNIPFVVFTSSAVCGLGGAVRISIQCHVLLPSLPTTTLNRCSLTTIYSTRVLVHSTQFLWSPDSGSLVCMATGKVGGRPDVVVPTNQGIFRTLIQREGTTIINSPIPPWLGTPASGPRFFWYLPWALFRTYGTCCSCINQVTIL